MDLVLYTNPMSRGRTARWALEEVAQPYRVELLDYDTVKGAGYAAVNPMAKVPALRHGDTVITEVAAICAYLADAFPEAELAQPLGDVRRGPYFRWMFFSAGPVEAAITDKALGVTVPPEREKMCGYGNYDRAMEVLEQAVAGGGYVAGDGFTMADLVVGAQIGFGLMFKTIPPRPAFAAYWARITERPAYQRAAAADDALIAKAS